MSAPPREIASNKSFPLTVAFCHSIATSEDFGGNQVRRAGRSVLKGRIGLREGVMVEPVWLTPRS